jgi:hypothetical protein
MFSRVDGLRSEFEDLRGKLKAVRNSPGGEIGKLPLQDSAHLTLVPLGQGSDGSIKVQSKQGSDFTSVRPCFAGATQCDSV